MIKEYLFSPGPFFTCFITIIILIIFFYYSLQTGTFVFKSGSRIFFSVVAIILIRMMVPINFPFTYSFYSKKILPRFFTVFYLPIFNTHLEVLDALCLLFFIGSLIQLSRFLYKKNKFNALIKDFCITRDSQYSYLYDIARLYTNSKITIAVIPFSISPGITGFFKPIIFLPTVDRFSQKELNYIFAHECYHLNKHDLSLLFLMDIVCCIHWWNPFVYILKNWFLLSMEITNDQMIMNGKSKKDQLDYASLILNISKSIQYTNTIGTLTFTHNSSTNLKTRIRYLCDDHPISKYRPIFQSLFVVILMIFSLFFVIESTSLLPNENTNNSFSISKDNAYFIKKDNGYELYVDGNYVGLLENIPDEFKSIPIKELGEIK